MDMNVNSRFSYNPGTYARRSRFDLSTTVKTSFDVGDLVPFYYEEVLPGDTFVLDTNVLARMQTLLTPIMDDLYLDVFYFYVPNRLTWEHWKEFMGENTKSAWYPTTEYTIPQITVAPEKSVAFKSAADYMGIPPITVDTGQPGLSFSALPFRAYGLIWNEWFRDENLQDPVLVDTGDNTHVYNADNAVDGGKLLKANKYHDYFTSALPSPQKGPDVTIPLANVAPVYSVNQADYPDVNWRYSSTGLQFKALGNTGTSGFFSFGSNLPANGALSGDILNTELRNTGGGGSAIVPVTPANLVADLQNVPVTTINSLRLAFATQRLYEKDARGGTRYREIIKSHFNTISPDARQQVPELLGYNRINISISQVVQNSETATTPQGHTAAFSLTADSDSSFTKSFTEHGMVIGLLCARYKHTYQQGIPRCFSRKSRFDYYWPVFANLGEQPVLNKEIFANGTEKDNEVFGYQEAWAEYRYHPDSCTSEMRSSYPQSLDVWHLGDDYNALPSLSPTWIQEDKSTVDRVLAVTSANSNQLFADIYVKNVATRVMPMFSIPGMSNML
nr:MAG: major capsid protein [Microviridae sp.]